MGYRSNVAIAIHQKVKMLAHVLNKPLPAILKEVDVKYHRSETDYFIFESIKWYSDNPGIIEVHNFFDWLCTKSEFFKDPNKPDYIQQAEDYFAFLRVGEDPQDIEAMGNIYRFGIETTQIITTPEYSFS